MGRPSTPPRATSACTQRLHDLSAVTLRYANVYGPRQDPLGEGGVVAIFSGQALRRENPAVFGSGQQTRDFVYVGDVVEANLRAAESDAGGAYNVGTGRETSVLELAEAFATHGLGEPDLRPPRPGEVDRSCLDCTLAGEELGWRAQTSLDAGLAATLDWARTL
jgi:UDP-glucose 4-epimerase